MSCPRQKILLFWTHNVQVSHSPKMFPCFDGGASTIVWFMSHCGRGLAPVLRNRQVPTNSLRRQDNDRLKFFFLTKLDEFTGWVGFVSMDGRFHQKPTAESNLNLIKLQLHFSSLFVMISHLTATIFSKKFNPCSGLESNDVCAWTLQTKIKVVFQSGSVELRAKSNFYLKQTVDPKHPLMSNL